MNLKNALWLRHISFPPKAVLVGKALKFSIVEDCGCIAFGLFALNLIRE